MRLRQLWRYRNADLRVVSLAAEAAARGDVVIAVPGWLAAEAGAWVYQRKVEHASEKWAQKEAEVPLWAWQAAMIRRREQ